MFFIAAGIIGFMMGGTQSVNRSTYAKMLPDTEDTSIVFQFLRSPREIRRGYRHVQLGLHRRLYRQHEKLALALIGFFVVALIPVGLHSETRASARTER